jgi:hypothetical protein
MLVMARSERINKLCWCDFSVLIKKENELFHISPDPFMDIEKAMRRSVNLKQVRVKNSKDILHYHLRYTSAKRK